MAKKQINYNNLNKQKESHKEEISKYETALKQEKEKIAKLNSENKKLRADLFAATSGPGQIKSKDKQIKKLETQIAQLKAELAKNDDPYYCFSESDRSLIKKIQTLHYEGNSIIYNDILDKFKNGTEVLLELARKSTKGKLILRDIYIYTFRDSLICLLEKTLQAITPTMTNRGITSILSAGSNHYETYIENIDKDLIDEAPLLKDKNTFKKLTMLVHIENTAFHGSIIDFNKKTAKIQVKSNKQTDKFLLLDGKEQCEILFTLIEFLYQIFTSSKKELVLLLIDQCWNQTVPVEE